MLRKITGLSLALTLQILAMVAQKKDSAIELMARAERKIYTPASSEADFTSNYYSSKGYLESQIKGRICVQGEYFRLEYGDILAVFDGKTLSHHNNDEETLTYSTPSEEELLQINPLYFLRSRAKGFNVRSLPVQGRTQTFIYTPKNKTNIKEISISYRLVDAVPEQVKLVAKDGGRIEVLIQSLKAFQSKRPQEQFTLSQSKYPNSEVVDLR